ncbi:MAG: hypothetical protein UY19_C0010G0053, partial [Candidatus Wolfebacteria bacterium GW2011_GWA2_47_9b]
VISDANVLIAIIEVSVDAKLPLISCEGFEKSLANGEKGLCAGCARCESIDSLVVIAVHARTIWVESRPLVHVAIKGDGIGVADLAESSP